MTEDELIHIYQAQTRALYGFVSRWVHGDRRLAEDVVQETWLRAVERWRRAGAPDRPLAWLVRVARNLVVSHHRRLRPAAVDPAELSLEGDQLEVETPGAAALVAWGLAGLRRGHAEVLSAFHLEGKSVAEIAGLFGLSQRAVEGRLRRARRGLARRLRPLVRQVEAHHGQALTEVTATATPGTRGGR